MKIVNFVSSNGLEFISGFIDNIKYTELLAKGWTEIPANFDPNGWTETPADPEPEAEVAPDTP